ncbi:unnamed protein product [Closterium sp. Naga37s-1]|nr:unnamed protein product [Closterium sp. Naga37s-1]
MTLAFLLVIPEGVFIVARPSRRRKEAMRLHLGLQLTGLVLALAGTLAMFTHRHARLKAHFSTPHAWLGVSAVILAELGGLLGVLLYFNTLRISRALIGRLHFLHRMVGRLVIVCGFIAIILALKIFDAQNPRNKGWKTYVMACAVVAQLVGMSSLLYPSSPIAAAVSGSSSGGAAGSTVVLLDPSEFSNYTLISLVQLAPPLPPPHSTLPLPLALISCLPRFPLVLPFLPMPPSLSCSASPLCPPSLSSPTPSASPSATPSPRGRDMEKGGEEEKIRQMVREASSAAAAQNASERKEGSQGNGASFDHSNYLGEGGFGRVYRGRLKNGQEVAVKRLTRPPTPSSLPPSFLPLPPSFDHANYLGKGGFGRVYRGRLKNGQEVAVKRLTRLRMTGSGSTPSAHPLFPFFLYPPLLHFDHANYLGEGGFGRVYRGRLKNGQEVAVKRLTRLRVTGSGRAKGGGGGGGQGEREFVVEVEMLSRLHHRNLVKLIGYCASHHHQLLCYELVPNGSLEAWLHGSFSKEIVLDWATRMRVALGAARGLAYLHEDSQPLVIHRDLKSSNILLENDFLAKVADFGLAKPAPEGPEGYISTRVMGTFGYVAPEYAMTGHLVVASDVYSYGVVLLELLTGRKPVDMSQPPGDENLVTWARPRLGNAGRLDELLDPKIAAQVSLSDLEQAAAVAQACVAAEPTDRPPMGEVVQSLKRLEALEHSTLTTDHSPYGSLLLSNQPLPYDTYNPPDCSNDLAEDLLAANPGNEYGSEGGNKEDDEGNHTSADAAVAAAAAAGAAAAVPAANR